jgi:hypothetical protein
MYRIFKFLAKQTKTAWLKTISSMTSIINANTELKKETLSEKTSSEDLKLTDQTSSQIDDNFK